MLYTNCQKAVGLFFKGISLAIKGANHHMGRAIDGFVKTGNRQTALVIGVGAVVENFNLRVDKDPRRDALFTQIHHNNALVNIDLRGGQAYTLGMLHGVEHICDQTLDLVVNCGDRLGYGAQPGVGEFENI